MGQAHPRPLLKLAACADLLLLGALSRLLFLLGNTTGAAQREERDGGHARELGVELDEGVGLDDHVPRTSCSLVAVLSSGSAFLRDINELLRESLDTRRIEIALDLSELSLGATREALVLDRTLGLLELILEVSGDLAVLPGKTHRRNRRIDLLGNQTVDLVRVSSVAGYLRLELVAESIDALERRAHRLEGLLTETLHRGVRIAGLFDRLLETVERLDDLRIHVEELLEEVQDGIEELLEPLNDGALARSDGLTELGDVFLLTSLEHLSRRACRQ